MKAAKCHVPTPSGFKPNRKSLSINLGLIEKFIGEGKLDAKAEITEDALVASGLVRRKLDGVRVLAKGEITSKVTFGHSASKAAIEAVEKAGGTLTTAVAVAE